MYRSWRRSESTSVFDVLFFFCCIASLPFVFVSLSRIYKPFSEAPSDVPLNGKKDDEALTVMASC